MKKTVAFLLALCLLTFVGCSGDLSDGEKASSVDGETTTSTTVADATIPSQRIEHIAEKLEKGMLENFDGYSDEEKEQIKEAVEKDGYTLEFNDDGSGKLSNEEGEWTVAAGWVDNEYTRGVPEMDFAVITMSMEDSDNGGDYYMFLIRQADFLEVENYVETLCQVGFDNIETKVINQDVETIVFEAENKDGKGIELGYSSNGFTIKIYK